MADQKAPEARVDNGAAKTYWEGISADDNGMLGGFAYVSRADLRGSRTFLAKLGIGSKPGQRRIPLALEGGAGIGRVTEGLLLDMCDAVDIVEPVAKFTAALAGKRGVRTVHNVGLEAWQGDGEAYGLIWVQWCTGYLNDAQLVAFLQRCTAVLAPGGVVVIKENTTGSAEDDFDTEDSSVTRADASMRALFDRAGLRLVRHELQRGFPPEAELLPVKMYALKAGE